MTPQEQKMAIALAGLLTMKGANHGLIGAWTRARETLTEVLGLSEDHAFISFRATAALIDRKFSEEMKDAGSLTRPPTDTDVPQPKPQESLSVEQLKMARHALGLPNRKNESYRNRFCVPHFLEEAHEWGLMAAQGFAKLGDRQPSGIQDFHLTKAGAAIALKAGESLSREDFLPESDT